MPPRRSNRSRRTGADEGTPNIAQLVNEQLLASLPNIVSQVAAGLNATQGNTGANAANNNSQQCTYKSFMSCKPREFKGSEGAVGLLEWIEGMETVLHISKCAENDKVEFASCQLRDRAQTWWKNQIQVRGREAANQLTWEEFVNLLTEEYCSKDEKQKLETEFWNHAMVGAEIENYTVRFHELARLVPHMVTPEEKRIDRYIWGLAPEIRGMVTSASPTTIQSAVVLATRLTNDLIRSGKLSKDKPGNKRKADFQSGRKTGGKLGNSQKRALNFAATTQEVSQYVGSSPKCNKCNYHHKGNCPICRKCSRKGHYAKYCKLDKGACFECGSPDHYRNVCPSINKGPNNNHGNRAKQAKQGNYGGQTRGRAL